MNIADIKRQHRLSEIVRQSIDLKPRGKEFWGRCPFHDENTASLCVQDGKGKFFCYGCNAQGDVIDFVMKVHNCTLQEAAERLGSYKAPEGQPRPMLEIKDEYADLVPLEVFQRDLPRVGRKLFCWNPKKERFSVYWPKLVHPYRLIDGTLYGCTIRAELPDKKIVPMLQMIRHDNRRCWSHFPFRSPRPLYGLEQFGMPPGQVKTGRTVLIVEGEKCADIARKHLGFTTLTWAGGGKAVKFSDWSILEGCSVTLWPDADEEGMNTMLGYTAKTMNTDGWVDGVKQMAERAGASQVRCLQWDKTKPKGWDAGDAFLNDKMSREDVIAWMKQQL